MLGIYSYRQSKQIILDEAIQSLNLSISQVSENLNAKFVRYDSLIRYMIYNRQVYDIVNGDNLDLYHTYINYANVLDPIFNSVLNVNTDVEQMIVYTGNRNAEERVGQILLLDRIKSMPWYNEAISDYNIHWITGNRSIESVCQFPNFGGVSTNDLLYLKMDYDAVFNFPIEGIKDFNLYIMDKDQFLYEYGNSTGALAAGVKANVNIGSNAEIGVNGTRYILIKKTIAETGWNIYFCAPIAAIILNISKIRNITILILFVCLSILAILTWIFSVTLVKRIRELNAQMKLVDEGQLQIEISSGSRDEIGELTNNFGRMLRNINVLIEEKYQSAIIQKEAELKALQAQITPHFLYNSLSLINWKAIIARQNDISSITTNLSRFYRTVLNKGRNVISIADEVANVKSYIEIQLMMHDNGFDAEYRFDEEIFGYFMLNTVLQPFAENAIEHGLDKVRGRRGKLTVEGHIDAECIIFIISDNGHGMDKETLGAIFIADAPGYGVKNVNERIKLFFGQGYGVRISSHLGEGTAVVISIPKFGGILN